ncbi:helix-turn-helix domain-containing protein [Gynuella sp.]
MQIGGLAGESPTQVGRSYGLGKKTIYKWIKIVREKGLDALAPRPSAIGF